jgi:hypothetical protein
MLKIGWPQPNAVVHSRVEVGCLARRPPLSPERHRNEALTPPTQTLAPALFIDADTIHAPLAQQVPSATRTAAEIKAWLRANAKARRHRRPLPGYSNDQVADIEERAARAMRTRPEALDAFDDKTGAMNRRVQKERATAAKVWKDRPDLTTTRDVAKEVARRIGGSPRVIETRIPKKPKKPKK